jgi:hypothetical protein
MRGQIGIALLGLCLLGISGPGEAGSVAWDDPAGDVKPPSEAPNRPPLDIVRVEVQGSGGALRIKIRMKDSLERRFSYTRPDGGNLGGVVAHLYIDADNKPETGGEPRWASDAGRKTIRGYEFQVSLQLGRRYGDGKSMSIATGDAVVEEKKYKQVERLAVFGVGKLRQGTASLDMGFRLPEGSREQAFKATSWKGDTIETSIPYAWLGLKAGDTIRLCYYERESAVNGGYSDDKVLKLD